jgi:hypothetical protein
MPSIPDLSGALWRDVVNIPLSRAEAVQPSLWSAPCGIQRRSCALPVFDIASFVA